MSSLALAAITTMPFALQPTLAEGLHLHLVDGPAAAPIAAMDIELLQRRSNLQGNGDTAVPEADAPTAAFGAESSMRWTIKGQWARTATNSEADEVGIGVGVQYFIVDDFAFAPELNLWTFNQDGDNAWGVSLDLLFQWHFWKGETWSVFTDFGCGMLSTNNPVPSGGSQFNFTPQAGIGVTIDVGERDARLVLGLKWHHISNASLYRDNPGRDSVEIYAGLTFPF
jgi:hypothetical protein